MNQLCNLSELLAKQYAANSKNGTVGNTGISTGPHLHYEVIYRNKQIDPMSFMDLTMGAEEYNAMVELMNKKEEDE